MAGINVVRGNLYVYKHRHKIVLNNWVYRRGKARSHSDDFIAGLELTLLKPMRSERAQSQQVRGRT